MEWNSVPRDNGVIAVVSVVIFVRDLCIPLMPRRSSVARRFALCQVLSRPYAPQCFWRTPMKLHIEFLKFAKRYARDDLACPTTFCARTGPKQFLGDATYTFVALSP